MTLADWFHRLVIGPRANHVPDHQHEDRAEREAARQELREIERLYQQVMVERELMRRRPPEGRDRDRD